MRIKLKVILTVTIVLLLLGGCQGNPTTTEQKSFDFTAIKYGIVKQKQLKIDNTKILYTLSLKEFNPNGSEFDKYNNQFVENDDIKFVYIVSETKIYDSKSSPIQVDDITLDSKIKLSLHFLNDYLLVADKISIYED